MKHTTASTTEHTITLTEGEASLLGEWLLSECERRYGMDWINTDIGELVSRVANHLNGVD